MDVTYAVINKPPRGGGAKSRDHPPLAGNPRPSPSPAGDDAYEVVTPPGDAGSPSPLGFNFRIGKPKGPREPPPGWNQP